MFVIATLDNYDGIHAYFAWRHFKNMWRTKELMAFREIYSRIGRIPAIKAMDVLIGTDKICETKISDIFDKNALEAINDFAKAEPDGNGDYSQMFMLIKGVETGLDWEALGIIDAAISIVLNIPGITKAYEVDANDPVKYAKDLVNYEVEKVGLDRKKLVYTKDNRGNYQLKS